MAERKKTSRTKGFFSDIGLPVAGKYIYPRSQFMIYAVGGIGLLLVLGVFGTMALFSPGRVLSNGPLSSNHANFSGECSTCHTPFNSVADESCNDCHEKYGDDLGIHSYETHYLYRSGDFSRLEATSNEQACYSCHPEHNGKDAAITQVSDKQCQLCHEISSFNTDHPEFHLVAERATDRANLNFPHILHVNEIRDREKVADIEKTCLYCHNADADGEQFQPINFEQHCDNCHLTTRDATPFLPIQNAPLDETPGVMTLETIQQQQRPGTRWAYYTNPGEFSTRGNSVQKRPLYHEDPWVMENLRRLRTTLYPTSGLPDLIATSADLGIQNTHILYEEAIETLRRYSEELRNQPDRAVQNELQQAEDLLNEVERRLLDPFAPLDETKFIVSSAELNPDFSNETVARYENLIDNLTETCQSCHLIEKATIQRAQADQQSFIRAEFNHRAHIIQTRCLDCHNTIPIRELAILDSIPPPEVDRAEIYNLPSITNCQTCHSEAETANSCITCHDFHPDKSQRSNLLLTLD